MGAITFDYDPAARCFRLVVGASEAWTIPELQGDDLRRWHVRVGDVFNRLADGGSTDAALEGAIDALLAYDRTSALGSRESVENTLTKGQVVLILQRIQAAHA
jgi:hypothetical protein